jgi:hypothetical protein
VLLLAATCCVQALLLALGILFAQVSADRAARGAPKAQAVASIPPAWRSRVQVTVTSERATVTLRVPSLLPGTSRLLDVRATSEART